MNYIKIGWAGFFQDNSDKILKMELNLDGEKFTIISKWSCVKLKTQIDV